MSVPQLPFDQPVALCPPPALRDLQSRGTIHRVRTLVGDEAWLVTGYDTVRRLFSDERLGRAHQDPDNAARSGESALFGGPIGDFNTEFADHARMRDMLHPNFTPKRMRALRPHVDDLVTGLLDDLAKQTPPADLHDSLALPLPILVICELLGVPHEDRDKFRAWSEQTGDVTDGARSEQGLTALFEYGMELVTRKRAEPADDVISRLAATDGVDDADVATLSMGLLFAGHETTVAQIGMGALSLLADPGQWQRLHEDPTLIARAVEEIMRAPNQGGNGIPRYARSDLEVDGVTVRAGELVLLDTGSANHDDAVFASPDTFDVSRKDAPHMSFGMGLRYCIGAPLARIELTSVFSQLVARFPTMALAVPVEEIELRRNALAGGVVELPVTW